MRLHGNHCAHSQKWRAILYNLNKFNHQLGTFVAFWPGLRVAFLEFMQCCQFGPPGDIRLKGWRQNECVKLIIPATNLRLQVIRVQTIIHDSNQYQSTDTLIICSVAKSNSFAKHGQYAKELVCTKCFFMTQSNNLRICKAASVFDTEQFPSNSFSESRTGVRTTLLDYCSRWVHGTTRLETRCRRYATHQTELQDGIWSCPATLLWSNVSKMRNETRFRNIPWCYNVYCSLPKISLASHQCRKIRDFRWRKHHQRSCKT